MSPATPGESAIRLQGARVWKLHAPAPARGPLLDGRAAPAVGDVRGAVLTVEDAEGTRGCWGPLPETLAREAAELAEHVRGRELADPGEVVRFAEEVDRHAHTGRGAVAAGALELACWDLLGQRYRLPVWRLLGAEAHPGPTAVYATCFGFELDSDPGLELAEYLATIGLVQKWRPAFGPHSRRAYAQVAALLQDREPLLSLDFGGRLSARSASEHCREVTAPLAWVEEAAPAGQLSTLSGESFPCELAAGEHCYTEDELRLLGHLRIAIWQPDAVFCGGLRRYLRAAELARASGARLMPHGGGLLVALHAAALAPPEPVIEYHLLLEPRRQAHLESSVLPGPDHKLPSPELPGWHGSPDWSALTS